MKKLVALMVLVCLAFGCLVGCEKTDSLEAPQETEAVENTAPAESAAPIQIEKLDYEKLFALHEADEVVMLIDGKEITWDEYCSWVAMSALQVEQYFYSMASYGLEVSWDDPVGEDIQMSYARNAVEGGEAALKEMLTFEGFAKSKGLELGQEQLEQIEKARENDRLAIVGEDGSEEDFLRYLDTIHMSLSTYERVIRMNVVNANNFEQLYGANCEKVSDAQAMEYLQEQGYMSSNHILLLTKDMSTGADLEESVIAEKKQQAEELAKELQAVSKDEIVKVFAEKKAELCEDSGKTVYPDGYVFLPGEMVPEFENGTLALEDYAVSEPIESPYGFHIILRLPLDAEAVINYDNYGNANTARSLYASYDYAGGLDEYLENMSVEYAEGFTAPELSDFIIK